MMAAMLNLRFHSVFFKPSIFVVKHKNCLNLVDLRTELGLCSSFRKRSCGGFALQALSDSGDEGSSSDDTKRIEIWGIAETTKKNVNFVDLKHRVLRFRQAILSLPPVVFVMRSQSGSNFALGSSVLATLLVVLMRVYVLKKLSNSRPGTVADLVRRGQLRYDRRGISAPLKFDDPFNNPMVKVVKGNSTVEMCGKVYRLAPVTLTKEQQATHQKRRSHAYQWKRPTTFLREGDPIPLDVDPDTIRWIPANHPFATTATDIDESLAQTNVYQKHGVPFRIQAEHEALQRKLEALQSDQKLSKLVIDPGTAKDFGRPFKSHVRSDDQSDDQCVEMNPSNGHPGGSVPEHTPNSSVNCSTFEELP